MPEYSRNYLQATLVEANAGNNKFQYAILNPLTY